MEKMEVKKWKSKSLCTRKNVDSFHQLRSTNIKKRTRSIRRWRREQKKNAKKSGPKSSAWKEKWTEKVAYLQPYHISFEKKTFALLQKKNFLKDFINKNMSGIHLLIQFTLQIKKLLWILYTVYIFQIRNDFQTFLRRIMLRTVSVGLFQVRYIYILMSSYNLGNGLLHVQM